MNAWILDHYGPPENLQFRAVPFPAFRDGHEVLVRVFGSSVNPADRHELNMPLLFRRGKGFLRPKSGRLGFDLAGRIELVGGEVKELRVGDEVFGVGRGAFGEYAVADESQVILKPSRLTFELAAAVPIAATTALMGLREKAQLRSGQRILINGASGGVGTFAVQIAKSMGAEVSAVCSTRNVELIRSLGASRVFDYTLEDFTRSGQRYDVIFDTQLNHSLASYRRILNPGGLLLIVGAGPGNVSRLLRRLLRTMVGARLVGPRTRFFIAVVQRERLRTLKGLLEEGRIVPVIERTYPLGQVPEAIRNLMGGHVRGKLVIAA